jgi:hypothetical protein
MSPSKPFWATTPRNSLITFLVGVFFIFSIIGFASDVTQMGRQSAVRLALGVVISGIFPVFYAISGFVLRKQFWKAIVPIFAIHVALINVVQNLVPALPKTSTDGC